MGRRDGKGVPYGLAATNLLPGVLHANTLESLPASGRRSQEGKTRRMQQAFAAHRRHVGRVYPRGQCRRVVLTIGNAPWHRGRLLDEAKAEDPHREFYRLPRSSPTRGGIERFREKRRRRATPDRLFGTSAARKASVRASLRDFQTLRGKVLTLSNGRPRKSPK